MIACCSSTKVAPVRSSPSFRKKAPSSQARVKTKAPESSPSLLRDLLWESSLLFEKRRLSLLALFALIALYLSFLPLHYNAQLTFADKIDPSTSEIVVNELFSAKELEQIIDQGALQWHWKPASPTEDLSFRAHAQFLSIKNALWPHSRQNSDEEIPDFSPAYQLAVDRFPYRPLYPVLAQQSFSKAPIDLDGSIVTQKKGYLLELGDLVQEAKWGERVVDPRGLWSFTLAPATKIKPGKRYHFSLRTIPSTKQEILNQLRVTREKKGSQPKLKLEHHFVGALDHFHLSSLIADHVQNKPFLSKLQGRITRAALLEKDAPKSHLFFEKQALETLKPSYQSFDFLSLNDPEESSEASSSPTHRVCNPEEDFEERAERYFDAKIFETHYPSSSEPVPALSHWLLYPLIIALVLFLLFFLESLWKAQRLGLPARSGRLKQRGFMVLDNVSTIFSKETLRQIISWLLEERRARFQLRETFTRTLIQTNDRGNVERIQEKLTAQGAKVWTLELKNMTTARALIEVDVDNAHAFLKIDFAQADLQLHQKNLPELLEEVLGENKLDFVLIHSPLTLSDPLHQALEKEAHLIVLTDLSGGMRSLAHLERSKTLIVTSL